MKVVLKVRDALAIRGMTQKELAARTGIRESTISAICRGAGTGVNIDFLQRIAQALEVEDIRELIDLVE